MLHRRPTAIAGLLLALLPAAATLSSCGFDYPTDRVNQIGAGDNDRGASVDALGIRVTSSTDGEGRLIGTLVSNIAEEASLVGITPGDSDDRVEVDDFKPVVVAPDGFVNLAAADTAIRLGGDFRAGDVIALVLEFSTDERATLNVPVVKAGCSYYDEEPLPTPEDDAEESEATEETEAPSRSDAYLCPEDVPAPGHGDEH